MFNGFLQRNANLYRNRMDETHIHADGTRRAFGMRKEDTAKQQWWTYWNGLGAQPIDPDGSVEDWLDQTGCNFKVEVRNCDVPKYDEFGMRYSEPSAVANSLVRIDTQEEFASVGNLYTPVQNKEFFNVFKGFIDREVIDIETVGQMRGGRDVFMLGRIKQGDQILAGGDVTQSHLLLHANHGSGKCKAFLINLALVCANAFVSALRGNNHILSVGHRGALTEEKIASLVMDAGLMLEQLAEQRQTNELLANTFFDIGTSENYFKELLGKPAESINDQPKAVYKALDLFNGEGMGMDMQARKGTAWGAFNAVTEWVDHNRGREASRQFQALLGGGAKIKERAYEYAVELAGVR